MHAGRRSLVVVALVAGCLVALPGTASAAGGVHWLCKPGIANNPCSVSLTTTRYSTSLKKLGVDKIKPPRHPKFDCFYVYPTVSDQKTPVANFNIDPELRSIALYQAARYSSVCRVYAPVYRQLTLLGIGATGTTTVTPEQRAQAYNDVRDAWRTYLRKFNKGRGVVLIGHSQGSFVLRPLIAKEIDSKPKVRKRLISAILLGGNVLVKKGKDVGGDFKHVRACHSRTQFGCVIAWSTFNAPAPQGALFGRTTVAGQQVLCTNPAALGGGSGKITPVYPSAPFAPGTTIGAATQAVGQPVPKARTAWFEFPGAYRAHCSSAGGANVLEIAGVGGAPKLNAVPTPEWGLHLTDANIALGNLVDLARSQAAAWRRHAG
jgi:Protein of unknown function (DUF3089)